MSEDKLRAFSVEEVAERLGLHHTTVRKMIKDGRLKAKKIGRKWIIPVAALEEFLRVNGDGH